MPDSYDRTYDSSAKNLGKHFPWLNPNELIAIGGLSTTSVPPRFPEKDGKGHHTVGSLVL